MMRTSAFFGAKYVGFFEIYGVSARITERGLSQCGHFANKVEGRVNFSRFCADILYGRPLSANEFGISDRLWNAKQLLFTSEISSKNFYKSKKLRYYQKSKTYQR